MGFLIGMIVWIALLVFGMGSFVPLFVDAPSVIIVIIPALVVSIFGTSFRTFGKSLKIVYSKAAPKDEAETEQCALFFMLLGNIAVIGGVIGTLIGGVIMLQNLDDPKQIGPALAIAVLTAFYGAVVKFFAYAAEKRVRFKAA